MTSTMFNLHFINQRIKKVNFNKTGFILSLLFIIGLILGALSIKTENLFAQSVSKKFFEYVLNKENHSYISMFLNSLLLWSSGVVFSFFAGLSAVGIPVVAAVPGIFGALTGMCCGYMYDTYLLKGLGYCAIIIFPAAALGISALISASEESLLMSKKMLSLLNIGRDRHYSGFKNYCLKYLIYLLICIASALAETVMYYLFSGLFVFQ